MKVTELPIDLSFPQRIEGPLPDEDAVTGRTPGLHLSDIYKDLEMSLPTAMREASPEDLLFYAAGGFMWEHVFSMAFARAYKEKGVIKLGEMQVDGIYCTPDNVRVEPWRNVETKCTWRSARKLEDIEKFFWPWLVQAKGYSKLIGTLETELHGFFMNGDYKPPIPCTRSLLLTFNARELEENWDMILRHAERMRKKGLI